MKCEECQRELDLGVDVVTVEKCVVGPRGIVPLGETTHFCSEECLSRYFSDTNISTIPQRVP